MNDDALDVGKSGDENEGMEADELAESLTSSRQQVYMNPIIAFGRQQRPRSTCTRIVCMSDTHGTHNSFPRLPQGDILIHAGDFTKSGELGTIISLARYFQQQQQLSGFRHVVCIAGNHDMTFHANYYRNNWSRFHPKPFDVTQCRAALLNHCTYLEDSEWTIDNHHLRIYGSPWTPEFYDWAFNLPLDEIHSVWERITSPVDVLITHGPPYGRCDSTASSGPVGCPSLLYHVQNRLKPRLHVFGHIHEGAGVSYDGHTLFVNASNVDLHYRPVHQCVVVDIPHDPSLPAILIKPKCCVTNLREWVAQHRDLYPKLELHLTQHPNKEHDSLPSQDDLVSETAFETVCHALHMERDKEAQLELRQALSHLYADSFGS